MKKPTQFLAALAIAAGFAFTTPQDSKPAPITIVIDAAHGGKDHGATHDGFTEKEIVRSIAQKISNLNYDGEVVIHMLREEDEFLELKDRVKKINALKPDLVLSLHLNYTKSETKSGMEFFVCEEAVQGRKSAQYAEKLADKFEAKSFDTEVKDAKFMILKQSEVPAIVFEMGFLSHEGDRKYLTDEKKQEELAGIVLDFIKEIK